MSNHGFYSEFIDRRSEVKSYLIALRFSEKMLKAARPEMRKEREKYVTMLRATALLVLYNAIEASARNAIEAVYDEFSSKSLMFGDLHESIRQRIISDFKNNVSPEKGMAMSDIAREIVIAGFDGRKLFSGNVDAREIRKVARRLGIDISGADYATTMDGAKLVEVKDHRNDLAHGHKSFGAVGRDYTTRDLSEICRVSLAYMDHILSKVGDYLDDEDFLKPPVTAQPGGP